MPGNDLPKDDRIDKLLEESMRANTQIIDFDIRIKECSTKIEKLEKAEQPNRQEVNKLTDQMIKLTQEREKLKTSFAESMVRLEQIEAKMKSEDLESKLQNIQGNLEAHALTESIERLDRVEVQAKLARRKSEDVEKKMQIVEANVEEQELKRADTMQALQNAISGQESEVQKLGLLVVKNARNNIDREREIATKFSNLTQVEKLGQQCKLREAELEKNIIDLTEECKTKGSSIASMFQQVEQSKTEIAATKELLEKIMETKKQNEDKIEALQTAASHHVKEIDKLKRSMIHNSQMNLRYETFITQLKDSLRELTDKVDRELNSVSEHINVLYQELHSIRSQLLHQTTSHTVQMTDFTKYSQTPDNITRRHSFPVNPTLHEETPLKPSYQGMFELPPLSSLPSTSTSVSKTITPRQRPQSVIVRTSEPHPEIMSHTTTAQDRRIRRTSYPSATPSHTKK